MVDEKFPNTFAPNMKNKSLDVEEILVALKFGAVHFDKLPEHIQAKVRERIEERRQAKSTTQTIHI